MGIKKKNSSSTYSLLFFSGPESKLSLDGMLSDQRQMTLTTTTTAARALELALGTDFDCILVNFDQETAGTIAFLQSLLDEMPSAPIIGLTEAVTLSTVVQAARLGIRDIINMKTEDYRLEESVERLIMEKQKLESGQHLHLAHRQQLNFDSIIGESSSIRQVFKILSKLSRHKWITVLVSGETGTGKELVARALHYNSFDRFRPFVEVNCAALPDNLLESELFGYEKGAFTDAQTSKKGLFEVAHTGTLFLDEIGEISPSVQVKLLKALEEKRIRRLGGIEDIDITARIIAATNRDLQKSVEKKLFRSDLFYRLNVMQVALPPLRDRGNDVALLAERFLKQFGQEYESPAKSFTPDARAFLLDYEWPGNVRELKYAIERLVLLAEGEMVTRDDIMMTVQSKTPILTSRKRQERLGEIRIPPEGISLEEGEKRIIMTVLAQTNWNKRRACQILQISRPRLDRKLKQYEIYPGNGHADADPGQVHLN